MYRDNTLLPSETIRLLALGLLAEAPRSYGTLATEIRHMTGRIVGPSLDLVGAPLEVLKVEGLVEPIADVESAGGHFEDELLQITQQGHEEMQRLLNSNTRAPIDQLNRLIIAVKIRFLHLLPLADQQLQGEMFVEISERELTRLTDLRQSHDAREGHMGQWLDHEIAQVEQRLAWYRNLLENLY